MGYVGITDISPNLGCDTLTKRHEMPHTYLT